jgi:23S rRNA (pseudouridine1915-N3)-methyltransferase
MKILLAFIGKTKSKEISALVEKYVTMSRKFVSIGIVEVKEKNNLPAQLKELRKRLDEKSFWVILHDQGEEMSSEKFANFLKDKLASQKQIIFITGGFYGVPLDKYDKILSLSKMTYSHELIRVMLTEQIYRALAIIYGHPYPK